MEINKPVVLVDYKDYERLINQSKQLNDLNDKLDKFANELNEALKNQANCAIDTEHAVKITYDYNNRNTITTYVTTKNVFNELVDEKTELNNQIDVLEDKLQDLKDDNEWIDRYAKTVATLRTNIEDYNHLPWYKRIFKKINKDGYID